MRVAFSILILIHGLIHIMGFVKGFDLAPMEQFKLPIGRLAGILWLIAAATMVASAVALLLHQPWWWMIGLPALLLSQGLVFAFWTDAKVGTVPNLIMVLPLVVAILGACPSSFANMYTNESQAALSTMQTQSDLITEQDLAPMPALVQQYLRRVGVVGKPHVAAFQARFHGRFRNGFDAGWMEFSSQQVNTLNPSARYFYMEASKFGIPMDGLHRFTGNVAQMQIRIASLVQVVDAKGPEMNQAETVTLFNDICVMAPAALVDANIKWTPLDPRSVRAEFTRGDITISATLVFNDQGDLVDFLSDDRFFSADGKENLRLPWSTPMSEHRQIMGVRLPGRGDATWHTADGPFVYGEFILDEIRYYP